jgi:FkbM family methyltransferase
MPAFSDSEQQMSPLIGGVDLDDVLSRYRSKRDRLLFMQVGAFDGISGDPLFSRIQRYCMDGVLIEPQRDAFAALLRNYSRFHSNHFTFLNVSVGACDGEKTLYRIRSDADGPAWLHQLASFRRDIIFRHLQFFPQLETVLTTEVVKCRTFDSIFKELGKESVDLLQIDVEGEDALLLHLFDIPRRKPAIICFEHKHLYVDDYFNCLRLLKTVGYHVGLSLQNRHDTIAFL